MIYRHILPKVSWQTGKYFVSYQQKFCSFEIKMNYYCRNSRSFSRFTLQCDEICLKYLNEFFRLD